MLNPTNLKLSFPQILSLLNEEKISLTIDKKGRYNYYLLFFEGVLVFEGNRRELEKALKFHFAIEELKSKKGGK